MAAEKGDDAIEAVRAKLTENGRIPLAVYRAFYKGSLGGFGPWVHKVNLEVLRRHGIKLRKDGDAYIVLAPEQQLERGNKHGRKAIRQKEYQIATYDGLTQRADTPEEVRVRAVALSDKAGAAYVDLCTAQRRRPRVQALLEAAGLKK